MIKKKWVRIILPIVLVAALACVVAVMVVSGSTSEKLTDRYSTAPEFTHGVSPDGERALLTHRGMKLYLEENMTVRVEDDKGNVWSTNGFSHDGTQTTGQFKLYYYTSNAAYSYMESQADSVDKQQAEAFLEDDTLYVQYRVGDYGKTVDAVPHYMTDERFRKIFLNHLSEEESALMQEYYKYYKEEDVWRIRPKGRNNFEVILTFMEKVEYTDEDLARDNADGGIKTEIKSNPWFTIVLAYRLTENGLSVSMPADRIEFSADFPLYEVDLLPHFGLFRQSDDGYVLLPDGSGALMRFSAEYDTRTEYTIPIYGLDWSVASDTLSTGQYQYELAALPVFGMKDGSAAYLAEIDGGAAKARLKFHQAGSYFQRNAAYVTFRMINKDSVYLSGSDNSSKVIVFESGLAEETCCVHYQFLAKDSGYSEMARHYRSRLEEQGVLSNLTENADVSLLLETVCGVWNKKNTLGLSYEGITAATTYEQNILLADDLRAAGVDGLDIKLIGWFNDGVYHDYAGNVKLNRVLGGTKGWNTLVEYAKETGVGLYPDVDFQRIPKASQGFLPMLDSAFRLDSNEAKYSILSRALLLEKEDIGLTPCNLYLLSPGNYAEVAADFLKDFASVETQGLSLRSTRVYSDFNDKSTISRTDALKALQGQLELLSAELDLLVEEGAAYTLPYTQKLSGVASDSSHYRIADETVPFLQMVLHGSVKMYTAPINLASNSDTAVLRAIEYGMLPCFQVTYEDSSVLRNSEYTDNYASGYESWRSDIIESYAMIQESLEGLVDCALVAHRQAGEQVYASTYSNGDVVYVNYGTEDTVVDGHTVPAGGFYRERSEQR